MAAHNWGHQGCQLCEYLLKNKGKIPNLTEENYLTIDVGVELINKPHPASFKGTQKDLKKERDNFNTSLKKKLCALRNSKGGALLVHINGLEKGDRDLDNFHQLVDVRLNDMIEDGSLFVDIYKKTWLTEAEDIFYNFLAIIVIGSPRVVTFDFKTKTPLDDSIIDTSPATVHKLLTDPKSFGLTAPVIRGLEKATGESTLGKEQIRPFQTKGESRSIQAKAYTVPKEKQIRYSQTVPDFIKHIWETQKLRSYITSFSKLDGGGSFYLGIEEIEKKCRNYSTKALKVKGFKHDKSRQEDFIKQLGQKVNEDLVILGSTSKFRTPSNLIKAEFHPVLSSGDELYVLEVAVAGAEGIVFYDKEGPEAYELINGNCERIGKVEWLKKFKRFGVVQDTVHIKEAKEVNVRSLDQNFQSIRQIGSSIDDIRNHVIKRKTVNIYPQNFPAHSTKEKFSQRIKQLTNSGLVYISDNLSVCSNVVTETQPPEVLFDACLIVEGFPPFVLSFVNEGSINKERVTYNLSLARAIIGKVRSFTDQPFSALYGVISEKQLDTHEEFQRVLKTTKDKLSKFHVPTSLQLPCYKREHIILALLSSVALTTSVDVKDDTRWFFTLEQFSVFTENIDQREVTVRTAPSSGGKVLMREVARRLERSGPTLLVLENKEQLQLAREKKICSFMMTVDEWRSRLANYEKEDMEGLTNMVTNCQDCLPPPGITGRSWTFVAVQDTGHKRLEAAEGQTKSVTSITDTASNIEETTQSNPLEAIINELRKDLENATMENSKLKSENTNPIQEKLSIMVDNVSVGLWSSDSDYGSDTSSLASFGSLSVSNVDRTDPKGETDGQRNQMKRMKTLTSKGELGTIAEEGKKLAPLGPLLPIYVTAEGPLYVLTDRKSTKLVYLLCVQHEMDKKRVNTEYCHVTEDRQLVNTKPTRHIQQGRRRFKKYRGTCSTSPIHPPLSPSSPTPVPPAPQYWETEAAMGAKGAYGWTVMEIGLAEEDRIDSGMKVYEGPRSWCVRVGQCGTHMGYCRQVWNQGKHVKCVEDTLSNTPGTSYTLRYGVVVDIVRGRVAFVDVDKGVVLEKIDVEFTQTIYPVFGVSSKPGHITVEIRMISGSDITMTEDKQKLIYSCLT